MASLYRWATSIQRQARISVQRQREEERTQKLDEQDNQRLLGFQQEFEVERGRKLDLDARDDINQQMDVEVKRAGRLDAMEKQRGDLPIRGAEVPEGFQLPESPLTDARRPAPIELASRERPAAQPSRANLLRAEVRRKAEIGEPLTAEEQQVALGIGFAIGPVEGAIRVTGLQVTPAQEEALGQGVSPEAADFPPSDIGAPGGVSPFQGTPILGTVTSPEATFPGIAGKIPGLRTPGELGATIATLGVGGPLIGPATAVTGSAGAFVGGQVAEEVGVEPAIGELVGGLGGAVTGGLAVRPAVRGVQRALPGAAERARLAPEAGAVPLRGEGVPFGGERSVPLAQFDKARLPAVPEGHTRMFRGESPFPRTIVGESFAAQQRGRWFTTDPDRAARFAAKAKAGEVRYIDVPNAELSNWRNAKEVGVNRPADEFLAPEEFAQAGALTPRPVSATPLRGDPHVAKGDPGPPPPPRKPPAGPSPDDPEFRNIQEVALKGEKPEETLIRRHEGAIQTARRGAQIQVDEGNKLLREAQMGQPFRGTVVSKAGQVDEFDELYRYLHNPSKVQSGEFVVPERLRPSYDKLRELTDWEQAARLDFDPEMALVEDYFYRGWKPPKGMFTSTTTRGPLGRKPGFKMPRVNATYDEMRAAGFEPLFWNPFEQWQHSRMMGVRYREQMQLIESIKGLELATPHSGGSVPEGWRVPRVGPAFEGKPFAIVDEAGDAQSMFTRRWLVPDTMADRLENIYGVAPQLGTVEIAGRPVNLAKMVDAVTFIPKRAKLVASVFQHVDFLTRSHIGAWTGMVNALRKGQLVAAVKHLAVWPNSARKILQATVHPGYRQGLRRWALDTTPLVPERPGLTMKSVSEAGLSLQDVTILPADIDEVAREIAQEAIAAKVIKSPARALAGFERVHRQGLFQGVYPAAILTDVQNNIAPIMVRNYPQLTDAQLAGQIAKVASTKYSTIPASMSVVQNRTLRGVFTRLFFSMGESEGLLRQATGALKGPQAAFWRDHWVGAYVGLIAAANAIHFVSTGEPLPFARYSPISRDKWGPLPFGYNRDFAAPTIPLTGRSGAELTLDLVGQLDTAFRILDPVSFVTSRESVPVRTAQNQIAGADFFGAPIDEVGPGGIVSRTSQFIFDMFAPIGFGQAGLELARSNVEGAETIIRPGEDRLGAGGTLVQATGVNLRAETTPQLLDRIRAEVMREKEIGGSYEDIKATDSPLANEIDDEVEKRIGQELELRRETAEIRGQVTPQGQGFQAIETTREVQQAEQLDDDANLNSGQWGGDIWRDKYRDRQRGFFSRREQIKQDFQIEFGDKEAPSKSVNAAINAYFDVNIDDYLQPDGTTEWAGFFGAQDKALAPLSAKDKKRVKEFIRKFDTPTVTEFRKAKDVVDRFYDKPKYEGLSLEEGERLDEFVNVTVEEFQRRQLRETGRTFRTRIAIIVAAEESGLPEKLLNVALLLQRERFREQIINPERDEWLIQHERILSKFYPDLLERELSRAQEAELGEQAFEAIAAR